MPLDHSTLRRAIRHLRRADPVIGGITWRPYRCVASCYLWRSLEA